jgi:3-deoxy-D-manno-octulosonate 8-phosphate phosphatase (KDO 8-P phosphatase)
MRDLRALFFDVDGVLTDGLVTILSDGHESKTFSIRDGAALVWARREGLLVGLISGRPSEATSRRAEELGITIVSQSTQDKLAALRAILTAHDMTAAETAFMGDDLLDLPVLQTVGVSAAPADAVPEVIAVASWTSRCPGGRGAVREFVEAVLRAKGRWPVVQPGAKA